ncbi:hypothetical protein CROQUDRAFT_183151 [Cronartium quercuum f. sp. fusiforme G11]|uniref:Uncharacterized protein n=1 Tax=Cronartium quercuum f. sp. fusiforme G11 TaxID=708437 RepID=A0A9P6NG31_9BASI|nr:hypothetical protein CROQUDRAFT_183151 [Cronartium quercuum f. sp. fusiforme G11]
MKFVSVILSPSHLRNQFLIDIRTDIDNLENNNWLKDIFEHFINNSYISQESKIFRDLVFCLPPKLSSNGFLIQIIREHNLWIKSIKLNHGTEKIESDELLTLLEFDSANELKNFIELMIKRNKLNAKIIESNDDNEGFWVKFLPFECLNDEKKIEMVLNSIKSLSHLQQTFCTKKQTLKIVDNKVIQPKTQKTNSTSVSLINQSTKVNSKLKRIFDNSSDDDNETEEEKFEFKKIKMVHHKTINNLNQTSNLNTPKNSIIKNFRQILEKEGVWNELCETSATRK